MEYDSKDENDDDSNDENYYDSTSNDEETRNKSKEMDEKKRGEFTNIVLDAEMKELIIRESKTAQDPNHPFYISKQTSYEIFHDVLKAFMIKNYNKKPTQTDNLAYLLLLGYPEHMVRNFNSMSDLKLAFTNIEEESDFKPFGFERGLWEHTCICNEPICDVHRFQNIHSGINFNIGSVCNNRYGLISKKNPEYKSNNKKLKEHKEKERERKEGKPEGFYAKEKESKKQEKEILKLKKLDEKESKKREKELNKLNKNQPGCFKLSNCVLCNKEGIYRNNEIKICSKCIPSNIKTKHGQLSFVIQRNNAYKDCVSCEGEFIDIKNKTQLCNICQEKWCLEKCQMCPQNFLKNKNLEQNDLYCPDCEDNLFKCIDCERDIVKPSERCYKCHHNFVNKITVKICDYCDDEFEVKEDGKWKTCCSDCYFDNRKLEKCQDCNDYFKKMKNENWRTRCGPCYYKNKNKV